LSLALVALLLPGLLLSGHAAGVLSSTSDPDLSNDDLWDNGFGFGPVAEDFARVYSIAVIDSDVYVGGRFNTTAGMRTSGIAKWDGATWSSLGGGLDNCRGIFCFPTVYTLAVRGKDLYAGGNFASISGVAANRVARWDGEKWSALGGGVEICDRFNDCVTVLSLAATESELFTGGRIITDAYANGDTSLESFTRWDGHNWTVQGQVTGLSASVALYSVEAKHGRTYVGGVFKSAGSVAANNIASFDGTEWSAMGGGVQGCVSSYPGYPCSPHVFTIGARGEDLYVGGGFNSAGGTPAKNIAKWDGSKWTPLGEGANGSVLKIAVNGNMIYAGGQFSSIGGIQANGIARFDGQKWEALGSGVNGYVDAIAFKDGDVYLGGVFSKAGGKTAHNFARWIDPTFVPPTPAPVLPQITKIEVTGKKLHITGERFDAGAVLLLNGEAQKTRNDEQNPTTHLIAKKSGKKIRNGDRLQIQNANGKLSPEFIVAL
jgi:hypothetical protein